MAQCIRRLSQLEIKLYTGFDSTRLCVDWDDWLGASSASILAVS
jgi:hypothetical protein